AQVQTLAEKASAQASTVTSIFESIRQLILDNFGQNGLYAAYIATAALIVFVASRLAKLTISTLKFLVIPSVALAFGVSLFAPYSFAALLPVSVTLCSMVLLFKG
ncbi:MAG TPA: hypothetical protein VJ983_05715, partial [candidate division Zixibacteria bacterium]|nr:hypothetical protein [candidate division Zixibacteria bacterium]